MSNCPTCGKECTEGEVVLQCECGKIRIRRGKKKAWICPSCFFKQNKNELFSNMCAEEIKKVAKSLYTDDEYEGTGLKLLMLIGNLADVVMNLENRISAPGQREEGGFQPTLLKEAGWRKTGYVCGRCDVNIMRDDENSIMKCPECGHEFARSHR